MRGEPADLIRAHVVRVDVQADYLVIELRVPKQGQPAGKENETLPNGESGQLEADRFVLRVPWQKPPSKRLFFGRDIADPAETTVSYLYNQKYTGQNGCNNH